MENMNDSQYTNILKADALIMDYTLSADPKDRDLFLSLAGDYIQAIDYDALTLVYHTICDSAPEDKDIHVEILIDLLETLRASRN